MSFLAALPLAYEGAKFGLSQLGVNNLNDAESLARNVYGKMQKYQPTFKTIANTLLTTRGRRSAAAYLKKLPSRQGLKKFLGRDMPKAMKFGASLSKDLGKGMTSLARAAPETSLGQGLSKGGAQLQYAHELLEKYNDKPRELARAIE
jgi:hypothetical protein